MSVRSKLAIALRTRVRSIGLARKGGAEGRHVAGIGGQAREHFGLAAGEPQLDGLPVEHGSQLLLLQGVAVRLHPRQ